MASKKLVKVCVGEDEFYGPQLRPDSLGGAELEVSPRTLRRWRKITRDFLRMSKEIGKRWDSQMAHKIEEAQRRELPPG